MKIIKRIKFSYHITMAKNAMKKNNVKKYKKHTTEIKKLIWD